jgi:precorrin-6A/cobalt-precorrin-6A reductase
VDGLVRYLEDERIDAVVDATHPFAATMTRHAVAAASETGIPILGLRRAGWRAGAGDRWVRVRDLTEAAARIPHLGNRVFLTTGRQSVGAFARLDDVWFLSRSVEMPTPPMPERLRTLLDRGPFTLDGELRLLREHRINLLVTKDSGGPAPKLEAARRLGLSVLMVDRPAIPDTPTVETVHEAMEWVRRALPKVAKR